MLGLCKNKIDGSDEMRELEHAYAEFVRYQPDDIFVTYIDGYKAYGKVLKAEIEGSWKPMFHEKTMGADKPLLEKKAIIARAVWKIKRQAGAIAIPTSSPLLALKWSSEHEYAEQEREWKILQELSIDHPHIQKKFERFEPYED